jgi:hypothetical protein
MTTSSLKKSDTTIENQFYKITYDVNQETISRIVDKKSGKELLNINNPFVFGCPTIEKFQLNQNHKTISGSKVSYEIIDENPVRMILRQKRENEVLETIEFSLLDGVDKIFVNATVNLNVMQPTLIPEEYGLPFSFDIKNSRVKSEILGGYIEQDKDRLPGIDHDGVSLRRAVSIFNDLENIIWSTADARVVRIRRDETTGNYVIISNPVTNFPDNWNRHENLSGKIMYRYAFSYAKGSFDPAATSRNGYELNTPLQVRKSWFRPSPSHEEFISIDNQNIILLNLKSTEAGFILRLINSDSQNSQRAIIKSRFLPHHVAEKIDLLGLSKEKIEINNESFQFTLRASEIADFLINPTK